MVLLVAFPLALIYLCLDSNFVSDHYCPNCGAFLGTEIKIEPETIEPEAEPRTQRNSKTKSRKSEESPKNDRGEESGEL